MSKQKDKTYTNEIFDIFFYKVDEDGNPLTDEKGKTIVFVSTREVEEMDIIIPDVSMCLPPHDEDLLELDYLNYSVAVCDDNAEKASKLAETDPSWGENPKNVYKNPWVDGNLSLDIPPKRS